LKHLGLWNIRSHSPPSLPNLHPPLTIDAPVNVESYFQDFLPRTCLPCPAQAGDHYIVDQPFFPYNILKKISKGMRGEVCSKI
jgi:hypothetical protein